MERKIERIYIKKEVDSDSDHDYLGMFGVTAGKFAIKHSGYPNKLPYFNAENVSNMKEARQNYKRSIQYEKGEIEDYGIKAVAEIMFSTGGNNWLMNEISSGGLWGIPSDSSAAHLRDEAKAELDELTEVLIALGFTDKEIAPHISILMAQQDYLR